MNTQNNPKTSGTYKFPETQEDFCVQEQGCPPQAEEEGFDEQEQDSPSAEDEPTSGYHNIELGRRGEEAACDFLVRQGFQIMERNWSCGFGEADIIACIEEDYGLEIHFVEVKTRMSTKTGFPAEAVDAKKRRKYEGIAECYLHDHFSGEARITFDIISILVNRRGGAMLKMHKNVLACDCG